MTTAESPSGPARGRVLPQPVGGGLTTAARFGDVALPPLDELVRAGALIVGVRRRDAAVVAEVSKARELARVAAAGGAVYLLLACVVALVVHQAVAALSIISAGIAACALIISAGSGMGAKRELGYRPDELVALIGYVEAREDGDAVATWLGEAAVAAYLAWSVPVPRRPA